jgi:hypothetical protein
VIDPHGDLATDCLTMLVDRGLTDSVRYIDFNRRDRYIPWNILDSDRPVDKLTGDVLEAIERAWPALAGGAAPQFENIFLNAAHILIENRLPITKLPDVVTNKVWREELLAKVDDENVKHFWHDRFDRWTSKEATDNVESTLRRIFLLTYSPALRYTLGQMENWLDFRTLMDNGISLIFNLGGLGEREQRFIGCLLTIGFEVAALSREDIREHERRQYHLFLDEFSMFSAQSEAALARILSLTRKYGLFLVMAHQTFSQISKHLQGALQNTLTISFRLGRSDAEWMAKELTHYDPGDTKHAEGKSSFTPLMEQFEKVTHDLESLKKRTCYVKLPEARHFLWWKKPRIYKVKTTDIGQPAVSYAEVQRIKELHATVLMTPVAQIAGADAPPPAVAPPARR